MSDTEEPPTKVAKFEMSQTYTQHEELDESQEGQEEWLSEDILTDDDYNPAADQDQSTTSQPLNTTDNEDRPPTTQETNDKIDANIEQTLNSMDNSQNAQNEAFDALLKEDREEKKEQLDGNDTDDLLRMLEDDDKTKKVKVMTKTKPKESQKNDASSDDDDDGYIFQGTTLKKVKVAKNAMLHKYPTKAMPETTDDDETDASSEDIHAIQNMFGTKKPAHSQNSSKQPQKQTLHTLKKHFVPKKVVRIANSNTFRQVTDKRPPTTSTPLPRPDSKSLLKPGVHKPAVKLLDRSVVEKSKAEAKKSQDEHEEIINEEEFLEEDDFDLDEDFAAESDSELENRRIKQRIMRPEQMDEDMLSDAESHSDDGLYDELPSSDSDDMDEWFTLDIRAERAGDYLPLLGSKAYELLSQEKARVSSRLASLRQSVGSLSAGSRQQAERVRAATRALAEVDDMLRAA